MNSDITPDGRKIWSVSELNRAARETLEDVFPRVWVEGEISNFRVAPSGHAYFSLKDQECQIPAVMFRFSGRGLKFEVQDGLAVLAGAGVTVYEKRGQFQLIVEELEPRGKGALQLAFEQLKEKLHREGLFDPGRKKPLPLLPRRIGVVTSPTGAAIRDMIQVIGRRFANVGILLNPVRVQGEGAAGEIAQAIAELNRIPGVDVLIVGRGGGSIEDLWAFNEEVVARAIAASRIPVIAAVGHETDVTIADFAADLRAPTPSAAAELVVRSKADLETHIGNSNKHLAGAVARQLQELRYRLETAAVRRMISDTRRRLMESVQVVDDLGRALQRSVEEAIGDRRSHWSGLREALFHLSPQTRWELLRERYRHAAARMGAAGHRRVREGKEHCLRLVEKLEALSPLAVLARGYSICRRWPSLEVVKDAAEVPVSSEVNVKLSRGEILCRVQHTAPERRK